MLPFVTVIIPAYNEERHIADTLARLMDTTYPFDRMEVIVADGMSSDATAAIARQRGVKVVCNPKRLQSAGMNLAVREADPRSEWIIRCDCHAIYPDNFVARVMEVAGEVGPRVGSIQYARKVHAADTRFRDASGWAYMSKLGGGTAHRTTNANGPIEHSWHGAFRREAYEKVGGYDEAMPVCEDVDLSLRLLRAGYVNWNDVRLAVGYVPRGDVKGLWNQFRGYGRGRVDLMQRHPGVFHARHLLLVGLIPWTIWVVVLSPWFPWMWFTLAPYILALIAVSFREAYRNRNPSYLLIPPILATMHYSWGAGFLAGLAARLKS